MPAVQLSRLTQQINNLVWQFTRPTEFLVGLRDLFELYANRIYRAGQAVPPISMVQSYHTPLLVLRQLEIELRQSCRQHPMAALALVDVLWTDPMLEPRLLAMTLLGLIPTTPPEPIIERLQTFAKPGTDTLILDALLEKGGLGLRAEQSQLWIELLNRWANETSSYNQIVALRAISVSIRDERFANQPPLLRIFSDLLQSGQTALQSELQTTLLALLHISPKETVFLLRQVLPMSTNPTMHRLVRLSLSRVPPEYQVGLRQALQTQK